MLSQCLCNRPAPNGCRLFSLNVSPRTYYLNPKNLLTLFLTHTLTLTLTQNCYHQQLLFTFKQSQPWGKCPREKHWGGCSDTRETVCHYQGAAKLSDVYALSWCTLCKSPNTYLFSTFFSLPHRLHSSPFLLTPTPPLTPSQRSRASQNAGKVNLDR